MFSLYLKKQADFSAFFSEPPSANLELVVVIPAFNETSLIRSLSCLLKCDKPKFAVEVIVVFNASRLDNLTIAERNLRACRELIEWYENLSSPFFRLLTIEQNALPAKHAGVGLARKIGMDEAIRRFNALGKDGIIVCFDADSCCAPNYLQEIEQHFRLNQSTKACAIHFEHPLEGTTYRAEVYAGIAYYELHLRYYINGLVYAGLPFAFHTIGSSMAVRASAYCKEGGMNKRKAGEDFYFLQKFISNEQLTNLTSTTVYPSPRSSDRVPFGTGRAIKEMQEGKRKIDYSYAVETFEVLKACFMEVGNWYTQQANFNSYLIDFIGREKLSNKIEEVRSQSRTEAGFKKRFFQWFNAFQTLKFVHFLRDNYFTLKPLDIEAFKLLNKLETGSDEHIRGKILLNKFRKLDKLNQTKT